MEDLEQEFEHLLVKTKNAELIDKYADLKAVIYKTLSDCIDTMNYATEALNQIKNGK